MMTDCVVYLIVPGWLADHVGEAYPSYEGGELSVKWGVSEGSGAVPTSLSKSGALVVRMIYEATSHQ